MLWLNYEKFRAEVYRFSGFAFISPFGAKVFNLALDGDISIFFNLPGLMIALALCLFGIVMLVASMIIIYNLDVSIYKKRGAE